MKNGTAEIVRLAIDRSSAVNTYWNLYIAVATAVVGTAASGGEFTSSLALKIILTGAFALFALSNLNAIQRLGELRSVLLEMLPEDMPKRERLLESLKPATRHTYAVFHVALDIAIIACIWFAPRLGTT